MQITVLGAGTAVPVPNRSPASILIDDGISTALIDIGPGTIARVALQGLDYLNLQTIFLTHLHPDHVLDLATLFQIYESTPGSTRTTPLQLYGCSGVRRFVDLLMTAFPDIKPSNYSLSISEMGETQLAWMNFKVRTLFTGHTKTSLAYRFDHPDGSFVFTGDAIFSPKLVQFCASTGLLICECSFPAGWPTLDHMNADDAGRLAREAGPEHLVVTHLYPPAARIDIKSEIARQYGGSITVAEDGAKFFLKNGEVHA